MSPQKLEEPNSKRARPPRFHTQHVGHMFPNRIKLPSFVTDIDKTVTKKIFSEKQELQMVWHVRIEKFAASISQLLSSLYALLAVMRFEGSLAAVSR